MIDENQESSVAENKSLRDRIAEVIGNTSMIATDLEVADAVIAELGIHQEWGIREPSEPEPWLLGDTYEKTVSRLREGDKLMFRHITEWEDDVR